MMDTMQTIAAFFLTLGILVTVHEFGHYWVARRCGVKVLRFSIGFGLPLFKWRSRSGTEFVLALIPLGGYVKMLDEREGPVSPVELHQAFNRQPVIARMAVVAAGPLANFLLAIAALWLMFLLGIKSVLPVIGDVTPNSPAAISGFKAGEQILSVNDREVSSWRDFSLELLNFIGEDASFNIRSKPFYGNLDNEIEIQAYERTVSVKNWLGDQEAADPIKMLGMQAWRPVISPIIDQVMPENAAAAAGFKPGDEILQVEDNDISQWHQWVKIVQQNPGKELAVKLKRADQTVWLKLIPGEQTDAQGKVFGYAGMSVKPVEWPVDHIKEVKLGPVDALFAGVSNTASLSLFTLEAIKKMLVGILSIDHLSGPVTIAKVAGASIASGLSSFLYFLAMLSISLGVLNLLPVPVLDGGHLFYYMIELFYGRPLPESVQRFGMKIGLMMVLSVMVLALYNDIARF